MRSLICGLAQRAPHTPSNTSFGYYLDLQTQFLDVSATTMHSETYHALETRFQAYKVSRNVASAAQIWISPHRTTPNYTELRRTSPKTSHATTGPYTRRSVPINNPIRRSLSPTTATTISYLTNPYERLEPTTATAPLRIQQTATYPTDHTRLDDGR